ncbi:hypothetical protein [Pseudotabrizicola sp. L79]|uniref:hypothetical protein n=1 Tax=Pseudotabrizicola sp. L79 TaxID=3118402 RepID=UPI002F9264EC
MAHRSGGASKGPAVRPFILPIYGVNEIRLATFAMFPPHLSFIYHNGWRASSKMPGSAMSNSVPFDHTAGQFAAVDELAHALFESMTKTPKSDAQLSVRVKTGLKPIDDAMLDLASREDLAEPISVPTIEMTVQDISSLRRIALTKGKDSGILIVDTGQEQLKDAVSHPSARRTITRPHNYFSLPEGIEPLQGKPHDYVEAEVMANIRQIMVEQKRELSLRAFPAIKEIASDQTAPPPSPLDAPPESAVELLVKEWQSFFKGLVKDRKVSVYAFWAAFVLIIAGLFSAHLAQILIISAVCFVFGLCAHLVIEFLRDVAGLIWNNLRSLPKALPRADVADAFKAKANALTAVVRPILAPMANLARLKRPLSALKR